MQCTKMAVFGLLCFAAAAAAAVTELGEQQPAQYEFNYAVNDPLTGDLKDQQESRDGDAVVGYYRTADADGLVRTVKYRADGVNGFQAEVVREPLAAPVAAKAALPVVAKAALPVAADPVKPAVVPVAPVAPAVPYYYGYQPYAAYGYQPYTAYGYQPYTAYGYQPYSAYGYQPYSAYGYQPYSAYGYQPYPFVGGKYAPLTATAATAAARK